MCSVHDQKYAQRVVVSSHPKPQNMTFAGNTKPAIPDYNASVRGPYDKPPSTTVQTVVLIFFILLSVFSCLLTITLSYKWHLESTRQMDRVLFSVEKMVYDLNAFTDLVRSELVVKRNLNYKERLLKDAPDYDDGLMDEDYKNDRFMGRDLDNNWPSKSPASEQHASHKSRHRRDAMETINNKLHGIKKVTKRMKNEIQHLQQFTRDYTDYDDYNNVFFYPKGRENKLKLGPNFTKGEQNPEPVSNKIYNEKEMYLKNLMSKWFHTSKIVKNELNSTLNKTSNVEPIQNVSNQTNNVSTYNIFKWEKIETITKKPVMEQNDKSYEDALDDDAYLHIPSNIPVKTFYKSHKRRAAIDTSKIVKNELNSSIYEKSNVEVIQDVSNQENTVPTHNRRKGKKMVTFKKKPVMEQEQEDEDEEPSDDVAGHFISDPSKYNTRTHSHYNGNGRLKHPNGDYRDWTQYVFNGNSNNVNHFQMKDGKVELLVPGLYFVYAQIYYSDQHDINGYYVMKNDEKILGCTTTRHRDTQSDSCYTAGLIYLNPKDILSIKGLDSERYIILDPAKTFFGLFKISKYFK